MGGRVLTPQQLRCIYALGRKGGLDDEALHGVVYTTAKKEHISELTADQARRVIDRLKQLTGQGPGRGVDRGTKRQVALIFTLAERLGWGDEPRRLRAFLESQYGVSHPSFLDRSRTNSCIAALKAMEAGGRGERKGAGGGEVDGQPDR